jgi:hypothetical protein
MGTAVAGVVAVIAATWAASAAADRYDAWKAHRLRSTPPTAAPAA